MNETLLLHAVDRVAGNLWFRPVDPGIILEPFTSWATLCWGVHWMP